MARASSPSYCARSFCWLCLWVSQNSWASAPQARWPWLGAGNHPRLTLHADQPDADGEQDSPLQWRGYPSEGHGHQRDLPSAVLLEKTIFAFFLGTVLVEVDSLLQYLPVLQRPRPAFNPKIEFRFFREAVAYSFPLMTAEIAWVVLDSGDRFFIQHFLGAQALGFYAAAYGIATYLQDVLMAPSATGSVPHLHESLDIAG